jgi:hypothetical protein
MRWRSIRAITSTYPRHFYLPLHIRVYPIRSRRPRFLNTRKPLSCMFCLRPQQMMFHRSLLKVPQPPHLLLHQQQHYHSARAYSARSSARAPQLPTAGGTGAVARGWGAKLGLGGGRSGSKLRRSVSEVGTQGTRGGRAAGGATESAAVPDYMTLAMPSGGPGGGTMAPPNLPERGRTQSARMGRGGGGGGGGGAGSGVSGSGVVSGGTFDSCCIA